VAHKQFPILAILAFLAYGAQPDFTGKWELVLDKSDFGNQPKPARMTLESTVQGGVMHAVQNVSTGEGDHTTEYDWYLDGKRHRTDKPVSGFSITRWEGNTLISDRQSDDGSYKETIRMTLSSDRKTATEEIETKNPNGSNHEKLVWRKQ
jgi:hypothetical protein